MLGSLHVTNLNFARAHSSPLPLKNPPPPRRRVRSSPLLPKTLSVMPRQARSPSVEIFDVYQELRQPFKEPQDLTAADFHRLFEMREKKLILLFGKDTPALHRVLRGRRELEKGEIEAECFMCCSEEDDLVAPSGCGHLMGYACMMKQFKKTGICPSCRQPMMRDRYIHASWILPGPKETEGWKISGKARAISRSQALKRRKKAAQTPEQKTERNRQQRGRREAKQTPSQKVEQRRNDNRKRAERRKRKQAAAKGRASSTR
ncbi:hypothetical protein FRB99_004472 [Tulasnella sp. 403]|nr:hypothetical protein FRB99_004472 [Tulasnella sp. 403]